MGISASAFVSLGLTIRIRDGSESGLQYAGEPTFRPERRQCDGERTYVRQPTNGNCVPEGVIARPEKVVSVIEGTDFLFTV